MRSRGLGSGDRLGLLADGSAAYLAAVGGALRSGIVAVPIPLAAPAGDREYVLNDAQGHVLAGPDDWAALDDAAPVELAAVPLTRPMLYTSGTTGRRKGVWAGVWSDELARRAFLDEHDQWGFEPGDVHLVCSPLYHSAPLRFVLHTLLAGGEVLVQHKFEPAATLEALASAGVTTTFMVPAHLQQLVGAPFRPPRLRWVAHAGAPCPDPLKRRVIDWLDAERVWEFYGSTEAQFTACRADEWLDHPGTVGRVRRGRRLHVDPADSTIWCDQPDFARFEYWGAPEKTAAAWRGGACSVGDLGALDAAGRLYLRGRRDDLVVSGGVNVYPAEVERVLAEAADVGACAAVGLIDERWGQALTFSYTGAATEAELRAAAERLLVPAARPKRYVRVEELPVGPTGKVSRVRLADLLADVEAGDRPAPAPG